MPAETPCFMDTNIFLYAFIQRQSPRKLQIAQALLKENQVFISIQVVNELCVNLLKKSQLTEADLRRLITSLYRHYNMIPMDSEVLHHASTLREQLSVSYWDSLIIASALRGQTDIL